jgi:deazaflavin-dependent oxidoreductase (nitroreductase family)
MPLPEWLARANRWVTNPLIGTFAGRLPWFGILIHRGRRSGREYRTPLNVFPRGDRFVLALTYGPDRDWVKNVLAAEGCTLIYRGERLPLREAHFLSTTEGMAAMPPPVRVILRLTDVDRFLALRRADPVRRTA